MKRIISVTVVVFFLFISSAMAEEIWTPLPENFTIISPDINPVWGGILIGNWDNKFKQRTTVVVEKITSQEVILIYSWGDYPDNPPLIADWRRYPGTLNPDGTITATWNNNKINLVLVPQKDGTIHAEYRRKGGSINYATLRRVTSEKK